MQSHDYDRQVVEVRIHKPWYVKVFMLVIGAVIAFGLALEFM